MVGGNMLSTESMSATSSSNMYGGNTGLSATSPFNMSQQQGGSMLSTTSFSATSSSNMYGGNAGLSATSPFNMSQQQGGAPLSATSLSATSALPIQYDSLIGGKKGKQTTKKSKDVKADKKKTKKHSSSSSTSTNGSSTESSRDKLFNDVDASSSSTDSESEDDSEQIITRALRSDAMSEKTRELHRFNDMKTSEKKNTKQSKQVKQVKSKDSDSSTAYSSSSNSKSGSISSTINSSETPVEAIGRVNHLKYGNLMLTSEGTASESLVNAKQFYSSEHGDLFSSESNFLRNNINKNRLR
jgi:hypothetical protein